MIGFLQLPSPLTMADTVQLLRTRPRPSFQLTARCHVGFTADIYVT